jgi:GntR family transcriptional repressor for pyruvate dehydrogenase complex
MAKRTGALSPVGRVPLYELLVQRLRDHVIEAGLKAGDKLPPERVLAEELGVSRASVRQAIVALEVQGLIEVRHGGGSFLRRDDLNPVPLAQVMDLQRRLPDILDTREALEVKLAELAAERHTDDDLVAINAALDLMADAIAHGRSGSDGDAAFHAAITAAARSPLLAEIMRQLAGDITVSRNESLAQVGRPSASLSQHRMIAAAIAHSDGKLARKSMRHHLKSVRDVKLLHWAPPDDE